MKQTNLTGYGTIGCRIELNHADMIALGVEVDVIKDFLHSLRTDPETKIAIQERMAINRIVFFLEKFAIIPSEANIFTDSPEDFKKAEQADETTTADEPAPKDNVITVDISKSKNMKNLINIIYDSTDANFNNIHDLLNSAIHLHVPYISFKCTQKSKEKVIDNLIDSSYTIVQNTAESLQLETYMPSSDYGDI